MFDSPSALQATRELYNKYDGFLLNWVKVSILSASSSSPNDHDDLLMNIYGTLKAIAEEKEIVGRSYSSLKEKYGEFNYNPRILLKKLISSHDWKEMGEKFFKEDASAKKTFETLHQEILKITPHIVDVVPSFEQNNINIKLVTSEQNLSIISLSDKLKERPSFEQWLKEKYGVIGKSENTQKVEGIWQKNYINYVFNIEKNAKDFALKFKAKHIFKDLVHDDKFAVLVSNDEPDNIHQAILNAYYDEVNNSNKYKQHTLEQIQQQIDAIQTRLNVLQNPTFEKDARERLSVLQELASNKKDGGWYDIYATSAFHLSLQNYIALKSDILNAEELSALQEASRSLIKDDNGTDVSEGLKQDENFYNYLRNTCGHTIESIQKAIEQDANDYINGNQNRLMITINTPANQSLETNDDNKKRKIPRFLRGKNGEVSETDQIVITSGGMKGHRTVTKIWRKKNSHGEFDYYLTEYNAGAGCEWYITPTQSGETGVAWVVSTRKIKSDNDIEGKLKKLIKATRMIMFYQQPRPLWFKGNTLGGFCDEGSFEANQWQQQKNDIESCLEPRDNSLSLKGVPQSSGNCSVMSNNVYVAETCHKAKGGSRNLAEEHWRFGKENNYDSTIKALQEKKEKLLKENISLLEKKGNIEKAQEETKKMEEAEKKVEGDKKRVEDEKMTRKNKKIEEAQKAVALLNKKQTAATSLEISLWWEFFKQLKYSKTPQDHGYYFYTRLSFVFNANSKYTVELFKRLPKAVQHNIIAHIYLNDEEGIYASLISACPINYSALDLEKSEPEEIYLHTINKINNKETIQENKANVTYKTNPKIIEGLINEKNKTLAFHSSIQHVLNPIRDGDFNWRIALNCLKKMNPVEKLLYIYHRITQGILRSEYDLLGYSDIIINTNYPHLDKIRHEFFNILLNKNTFDDCKEINVEEINKKKKFAAVYLFLYSFNEKLSPDLIEDSLLSPLIPEEQVEWLLQLLDIINSEKFEGDFNQIRGLIVSHKQALTCYVKERISRIIEINNVSSDLKKKCELIRQDYQQSKQATKAIEPHSASKSQNNSTKMIPSIISALSSERYQELIDLFMVYKSDDISLMENWFNLFKCYPDLKTEFSKDNIKQAAEKIFIKAELVPDTIIKAIEKAFSPTKIKGEPVIKINKHGFLEVYFQQKQHAENMYFKIKEQCKSMWFKNKKINYFSIKEGLSHKTTTHGILTIKKPKDIVYFLTMKVDSALILQFIGKQILIKPALERISLIINTKASKNLDNLTDLSKKLREHLEKNPFNINDAFLLLRELLEKYKNQFNFKPVEDNLNQWSNLISGITKEVCLFKYQPPQLTYWFKLEKLWDDPSNSKKSPKDKIIDILNDYTKNDNRFKRILSWHWGRNHVSRVHAMAYNDTSYQRMDEYTILEQLKSIKNEINFNKNGTVAAMIDFIEYRICHPQYSSNSDEKNKKDFIYNPNAFKFR
jgi:hypothetical protein